LDIEGVNYDVTAEIVASEGVIHNHTDENLYADSASIGGRLHVTVEVIGNVSANDASVYIEEYSVFIKNAALNASFAAVDGYINTTVYGTAILNSDYADIKANTGVEYVFMGDVPVTQMYVGSDPVTMICVGADVIFRS
jgi:hypothetical protein